MILKYRQVKISQLVIKILLILSSFIFIYNAYKLSTINEYDSFSIIFQFLKSSLTGMKISYIFIIIFLLVNVLLTATSYVLFKENILDDIINIISMIVYLVYVIFLIEFIKLTSTLLSLLKSPLQANPESLYNAMYEYNFNNFENSAKIAGNFLIFGILLTIVSMILLIVSITNNKQLHFLSKLTKKNVVNPVNISNKNDSDINRNLDKNLSDNEPYKKTNYNNKNPKSFEDSKNSFDKNNDQGNEDFGETKILNRDEIIKQSYERKENKNTPSNSVEIKRSAYDFSSGLKKNSFEDKNEENVEKSLKDENFLKNEPLEENKKSDNYDENEKSKDFENSQINNSNTNYQESEFRKENPKQENKKEQINVSKKGQKKFLFISLGVLSLIILFFVGKLVYFALQPDAEFNTSGVDIEFIIDGYSGYAKAYAKTTDAPMLSQYKNKFLKEDIEEAYDQKITLDKEKNIKNGDEITATVEYKALPPYKIAFSDDKIEKKFKVKGLDKFINSYKDIKEDNVEKFEGDIQKQISDQYLSDGSYFSTKTKNLDIKLLGIYEKKVPKDVIAGIGADDEYVNDSFQLAYVYKINYDEVTKEYDDDDNEIEKLKPKETVVVYGVNDIREKNGAINYQINSLYSDLDEADALNKIKYDGYNEVKTEE